MDTSDASGGVGSQRQLFPDPDILRRKPADSRQQEARDKFQYLATLTWEPQSERFAALVKTISKGNQSLEDEILRCWGVR